MKKLISFSIMCLIALSINAQFVDLGLPSGTQWKNNSERGTYAFAQAVRYYDGFLPTSGQFKELVDNCTWTWIGAGYKVVGRNGNYIFLPAEFERGDDHLGAFWSITKDENGCCYGLLCYASRVKIDRTCSLDTPRSVILCK